MGLTIKWILMGSTGCRRSCLGMLKGTVLLVALLNLSLLTLAWLAEGRKPALMRPDPAVLIGMALT